MIWLVFDGIPTKDIFCDLNFGFFPTFLQHSLFKIWLMFSKIPIKCLFCDWKLWFIPNICYCHASWHYIGLWCSHLTGAWWRIIDTNTVLSPILCQTITSTNANLLSFEPLGTNLKMSSARRWPFCCDLYVLTVTAVDFGPWEMWK